MTDISKLPKWAQRYIERLERELRRSKELIENLKFEPGEADFYYKEGVDEKFPMPEGITVHIPMKNGYKGDELMISRQGDNCISIRTRESSLHIEPQASNSIVIMGHKR